MLKYTPSTDSELDPVLGDSMSNDGKGEISRSESGRLGGLKRARQLGTKGLSEMGKKGGRVTKERHGSEFYAEIGRKGGQTALRDRGSEFFSQIGLKGSAKVRELMARGRAAEEAEKQGLTAPDNATEEVESGLSENEFG